MTADKRSHAAHRALLLVLACAAALSSAQSLARDRTIAVSWSNFQEERWRADEAAIIAAVEANGDRYISADAQASPVKQLADIESLIVRGADALIILAMDKDAIAPAMDLAAAEGIPVIGYDRLIEDERAFYLTFDNKEVGRVIARSVRAAQPEGNFAIIKGDSGDPNAGFLLDGMLEVLRADMDAGRIRIVGESFTEQWKPDIAQRNMEQILTANNNAVDGVLAQNDGLAGGAIAALAAQGLAVPVGGQDGEQAALNRVARGTQAVSVWKDSRALGARAVAIASLLADGVPMAQIPGAVLWAGGELGVTMHAILLAPTPITRGNLNIVIEAGHIGRDAACEGALPGVTGC